jgi:hypothetical protein
LRQQVDVRCFIIDDHDGFLGRRSGHGRKLKLKVLSEGRWERMEVQ